MGSRAKKSTGMWGLDIADGRLRLVCVYRQGRRLVLSRAVSFKVNPDAGDDVLADLLGRAVSGSGLDAESVSICLPATAGYVTYENSADASTQPARPPEADFVTDRWGSHHGQEKVTLCGVVNRPAARRAIGFVRRAALTVAHVTLPQVATAAALGMLSKASGDDLRAGLVADARQVRFVVTRGGALVASRTAPCAADADAGAALTQIYRAAQISAAGAPPEPWSVIASPSDRASLNESADRLGLSLTAAQPGAADGLVGAADAPADWAEYAGAIGAALLALGLTVAKMNLLDALTQDEQHKPLVRRGFWVSMLALLAVGLGGALTAEQVGKRMKLRRLRQRYESQRPLVDRDEHVRRKWDMLRPWLNQRRGGQRVKHLGILRSITETYPNPGDAYVTDMDTTAERSDTGGRVLVNISGRATDRQILHACAIRLNEREGFEVEFGRGTDVEQALAYPQRYQLSITITEVDDDGQPQ